MGRSFAVAVFGRVVVPAGRLRSGGGSGATGGGSSSVKARFDNPNHLLRPGMFVRLVSDAEIAKNSVLVPRQAVQPLLDKQMILCRGCGE